MGVFKKMNTFSIMKSSTSIDVTATGVNATYYTLWGNCPQPYTGSASAGTAADFNFYNGLQQYAAFYNSARIHGCKVSVTIIGRNTQTTSQNALRAVLIPYTNSVQGTLPPTVPSVSATYDELVSWPGAKGKLVEAGYGMNRLKLSSFRRSKTMFNVKDIRSDPNNSFTLSTNTAHSDWTFPLNTWAHGLYVVSNNTGVAYSVDLKFTAYIELFNQQILLQTQAT